MSNPLQGVKHEMKGPASRLGIPAGLHGAADILPQPVTVDVRTRDPASYLERVFQDKLAMGLVFTLHRQAQADMVACGAPDLLAFQRPAQRIALDFESA